MLPNPDPDAPTERSRPLCVDLDGTLIKSDSLFDAVCQFVRRNPLRFWQLGLWLAGGRARLKAEVARRAPLDPTRLPYNAELLRYLQTEWREGRQLYLTSGADGPLAERVAAHLGIFAGVLASDGVTNLTSGKKLASLKARFGEFDYIGNSRADLPLLAKAHEAMVANPTLGLRVALRLRKIPVDRTFVDQRPLPHTLLKAIRIHQWAKNILLLAPLLLSHKLYPAAIGAAIAAFFCFSFMASANYLLNDMLDIESDRRHPAKRFRPFAAGDLSVSGGIALALALIGASVAILPWLPHEFAVWLAVYIVCTTAYSFYLKQVALVDVLMLSGLYTMRLLAGGAATGTEISHWLAGFSIFLFLSLAMVKRFSELENLRARHHRDPWAGLSGRRPGTDSQLRHILRNSHRGGLFDVYLPPRRRDPLQARRPALAHRAVDALLALPCLAAGLARRNGRRSRHLRPPRPGQPRGGSVRPGRGHLRPVTRKRRAAGKVEAAQGSPGSWDALQRAMHPLRPLARHKKMALSAFACTRSCL